MEILKSSDNLCSPGDNFGNKTVAKSFNIVNFEGRGIGYDFIDYTVGQAFITVQNTLIRYGQVTSIESLTGPENCLVHAASDGSFFNV
jgi:hypothetical protein